MVTLKALFYTALAIVLALLTLFGGVVVYLVAITVSILTAIGFFFVAVYTGIKKDQEFNQRDK